MHQCRCSAVISCLVAYTFMTQRLANGNPIEMMHIKYGLLLKPVLLLQTALYGVPSRCSVFKALKCWLGNHILKQLGGIEDNNSGFYNICSCICMGHDEYLHAQASEKCPHWWCREAKFRRVGLCCNASLECENDSIMFSWGPLVRRPGIISYFRSILRMRISTTQIQQFVSLLPIDK